ncbi:MAG: Ribonuclease [Candidatus Heimdallarchaeota archaeon LC_3]|nr:MAG: Ribonuclease [Candidatus Heimdallarchaeota archaeon LC_3]
MNKLKNTGLTITSYGAAQNIGKSAFLLSDNQGRNVLLDCGIQIYSRRSGKKSDGPKEILEIADQIEAVLLSHAHIDHSGFIPALFHHGFDGYVYTTKPTIDIIKILWMDHIKIEGRYHYNEEDMKKALSRVKGFNYETEIKICEGVFAKFYDAGHILGSCLIRVNFDGVSVLYTGDINDQETPFHNKYALPDEEIDVLLTETTNAERIVPNRENVINSLLDTIYSTYKRGGKMIIPSFALGRSQEMQFYLIDHLNEFLSSFPLVVDGMILKMNRIYEKYFNSNWVSEKAITKFHDRNYGDSPFDHRNLQMISRETINGNMETFRKKIMISNKRKIILSTSGMVEGGPLYSYLKYQKNPADTMAIVGYQALETVGRDIQNGLRKFNFTTPWGESINLNLQLEVETFHFSGHSSRNGIIDLIQATKPSRIFMIHGSLSAQKEFKKFFEKKNGNIIEQMELLEPVKIA